MGRVKGKTPHSQVHFPSNIVQMSGYLKMNDGGFRGGATGERLPPTIW